MDAPEEIEATSRLLSSVALGLAGLSLLELLGALAIGLAVDSTKVTFITKLGYGYLSQLDKSPVGLVLVVAATLAGVTTLRTNLHGRSNQLARSAMWVVVGAAAILALGTILAVLARFKVAELSPNQAIDPLTRRVLVVFVIRNFGTATIALLVSLGSLFARQSEPPPVA